jgi:hypothetical protein
LVIFLAFSLLCGCGNYYSVGIPYFLPGANDIIGTKRAVSSLYIVVKPPPPPKESALGNLIGGLLGGPGIEFNNYALAGEIAVAFSRSGSRVPAYRVFRSDEKGDPYAKYFNPTGILELRLSDLRLSSDREDRSSVYYDRNGQKQTVTNPVRVYKALVEAEVTLYSGSGTDIVDKTREVFGFAEERSDNELDPAEWYEENEGRMIDDAVRRLSARYLGREVRRFRPVFRKKDDKEAASAVKLARDGKWGEAEAIWTRRLSERNDWRDMLDLGVAAEVRRDYPAAQNYYLRAREAAAGDTNAKAARWDDILNDLKMVLSTGAAAPAAEQDWFAPVAAVLPFTDQTTSVDGPPMLRAMIYEALKTAGYPVQTLEETDNILRSHGFTQGGQLGAAERKDLCKWLGVERMFYGDISEFGEVMAGVYNRRQIKGRARLWDLKANDFVWEVEPAVVNVSLQKKFLTGIITQFAKGIIERLKNKPLAYESALFTNKTVEALPSKPH